MTTGRINQVTNLSLFLLHIPTKEGREHVNLCCCCCCCSHSSPFYPPSSPICFRQQQPPYSSSYIIKVTIRSPPSFLSASGTCSTGIHNFRTLFAHSRFERVRERAQGRVSNHLCSQRVLYPSSLPPFGYLSTFPPFQKEYLYVKVPAYSNDGS